jgi:RimJ/RimL family protein N-acetyltransferase
MKIQIIQVYETDDMAIEVLSRLDEEIFPHKADLFNEEDWQYFRHIFKFFLILCDGVVAGSVHLGLNLEWEGDLPSSNSGCLYIAGLGVLPEFRRQGIGTFAVQWMIAWAESNRYERVVADCRKNNATMIRIHKKSGFRIHHEIPDFWEEPDEPAVVLEKKMLI